MQEYLRRTGANAEQIRAKAGENLRSLARLSELQPQIVKIRGEAGHFARHLIDLLRLPKLLRFNKRNVVFDRRKKLSITFMSQCGL